MLYDATTCPVAAFARKRSAVSTAGIAGIPEIGAIKGDADAKTTCAIPHWTMTPPTRSPVAACAIETDLLAKPVRTARPSIRTTKPRQMRWDVKIGAIIVFFLRHHAGTNRHGQEVDRRTAHSVGTLVHTPVSVGRQVRDGADTQPDKMSYDAPRGRLHRTACGRNTTPRRCKSGDGAATHYAWQIIADRGRSGCG